MSMNFADQPTQTAPDTTPQPQVEPERPKRKPLVLRVIGRLFDAVGSLVTLAVIATVLLRIFVVTPFYVPSASMEPTLDIGDRIYGERISDTYERGDIITFTDLEDPSRTLVKRIIAVAGDEVDLRGGNVYVNGERLDEPYARGETKPFTEVDSLTFPCTVPEGHVLVFGDNRENSSDSRAFGFVPTTSITSRIFCCVWPFDHFKVFGGDDA